MQLREKEKEIPDGNCLYCILLFCIVVFVQFISPFLAPFDHFHFHPTLGLDPALILTLRLMLHIGADAVCKREL